MHGVLLSKVVDEGTQGLLVGNAGVPGVIGGQGLVENDLTDGSFYQHGLTGLVTFGSFPALVGYEVVQQDLDLGVELNLVAVHSHDGFCVGREQAAFVLLTVTGGGQVEETDDHVLVRYRNGAAV